MSGLDRVRRHERAVPYAALVGKEDQTTVGVPANLFQHVECFAVLEGKGNSFHWRYGINKNKIADYFLLLAFNNREDLEPIHQWLIPGKILNHLKGATISLSTTDRWKKYEQPIEPAIICCDNIRGED